MGDNAAYIVVDCLFTRPFWNLFTWTGINRGNKSKRGFREFGNVTQLIVNIVRAGDPFYTLQKFESFCKTRLFRYSKSRSMKPQLRKSSCRPGRRQRMSAEEEVEHNAEYFKDETDVAAVENQRNVINVTSIANLVETNINDSDESSVDGDVMSDEYSSE